MTEDRRAKVAVTICTHRRPDVLGGLLDRLVEVAEDARPVASIAVVVVDDDPDGSAEPVARSASSSFERGLEYHRTGSRSISTARNASLRQGAAAGDWLAMIDDDCRPSVNWVSELLRVQGATGADVVVGACADVAPADAPSWLTDEPFLSSDLDTPDGAPTDGGHLKNLLLSTRYLESSGAGFAESLGVSGGEDAAFLHELEQAGGSRRFAAHAVVSERIPPERATLRYQLRRRFWYGNTETITSVATGSASRSRMALGGIKLAVVAAAGSLARVVRREGTQWRYSLSEILRGAGRVLGAVGYKVAHR